MESPHRQDPLAWLHPAARAAPARVRVSIGAAVVLLILALITAVLVTALTQAAGSEIVAPGAGGDTSTVRPEGGPSATAATDPVAAQAQIFVHVLGAVRSPGLFQLAEGARVIDAIAAAGGLTETADPAGANLARLVSDGEQLYLPQVGEIVPEPHTGGGSGPAVGAAGSLVNINTASAADFEGLPRIGPALAQRIVDYRTANGRFTSVDGLRNVAGIGQKTFDGVKDLVTL